MEATTFQRRIIGPLPLRTFALRAGVSASYLSRVLTGKRRPLLATAKRIAKAAGMTLDRFEAELHRKPPARPRKKGGR